MAGKFRFPVDHKVQLKEDRDRSYALAPGGSQGWIRKQRVDYPDTRMVYIEWDANHWRYQGEPNQWTFEDHFESIEETPVAEEDKQISVNKLIEAIQAVAGEAEQAETPPESPQEPTTGDSKPDTTLPLSTQEQYDERLVEGSAHATEADAFIIISVERKDLEDGRHIHSANLDFAYKTEAAGYLLEAQIATTVMEIVRSNTITRLEELAEDDEPGR